MKKLILLLILIFPIFIFSQNVSLFQQFNGRYDFTAVGNTLNEFPNFPDASGNTYCGQLLQSSATLNLNPGQTFVSAHLYWGSIGTGDFDVAINGTPISAQRIFSHTFNGNPYFSAYADVTALVGATGNGVYTFSDMDVQALLPGYCGTNFGGWAIYVIYEDPSLLLNQISLFDGLESVSANNNNLSITLTNIDVSSDILSKIGFLAWEGEAEIANGESLFINGTLIDNPPLNPANNAFNGTNSYIGPPLNAQCYNMDLDYYDLSGIVAQGDTTILIELESQQDFIMVNNIITSVNSELPDATIVIDDLGVLCQNNNIDVEYTVYNVNSTNELPANTPIAFYADALLIGQTTTNNIIPIGGSESGTITLNIPIATPNNFNLRAVVDDIGDGTGIVAETDESNNEFIFPVDLSTAGILLNPGPACLGRPVILDSGVTDPPFNIQWFRNTIPIPGATNPTLVVTTDGIYSVEAVDGICRVDSNSVVITFRPQPVANAPVNLYQCDYGTTAGVFNLTDNDANILGGQDPALFTIKYYQSYQDSFDDTNEILGGVHIIVPPSPQTIYARIEDNTGSCFDLTDFKIYFSRAIAGLVPVNASYCDADGDGGEFVDLAAEFNPFVLDGEPSSRYNITYHGSQADADNDANPLGSPYFVAAPGETVYIRLENRNDNTCVDTTQHVDLIIDSLPTINGTPPNLVLCDDNNDGFMPFDLTLQTPVITLGDPTLTVSYHGTLVDAQNNALPLPNPYINDQRYLDVPITDPADPDYGTGGVWARVGSTTSSCTVVVPFALEVRFSPVGTAPAEPLRMCDDAVADGLTFFDLTVVAPEVLGTLDPLGFDLYYYEDFNDAVTAGELAISAPDFSQAIPDPTNFLNSTNPQDIYILIVSNAGVPSPNPNSAEGCYDIVTLTLIVDPRPDDLGPFEMQLCDDELQGSTLDDEISTFDLTSQDPLVTNGDPTIMVEWFLSYADEAADLPIPNPTTFQNTNTPQTVIGRVLSGRGCKTLVTLTLTVLPNPSPNTAPDPLELCDDDDDGLVGGWDLTLADADIIDGEADVSVLYYEDINVAMAGVPGTEIIMPYTNTVPFSQTVYARVQKTVPPATVGCFTIVELQLIVIALPEKPQSPPFADPFIGCDESGSGTAIFDLTLQDDGVLGDQLPVNFLPITYYELEADADAGIPGTEIPNPSTYISAGAPQIIWVRLESLITGCARVTPFALEVELFPTIGLGNDLTLCDDLVNGSTADDGLSTFDLTVNTPLITLGDPGLDVFYYATAVDQANNNPIPDPSAYQNIISPQQQIFVTAYSQNGCRATNTFFITVEPTPAAFSPGSMIACDSDNDGFALFDLATQDALITASDPNLTVSYHKTLLDAENNVLPITVPYENDQIYLDLPVTDPADPAYGTGGVWARVETTVNSCHGTISFALEVHTSPVATEPEPLRKCDDAVADGFTLFDLTEVAAEVLGALDPAGFDLYYYENLADAQLAGDLALIAPDYSAAIGNPGAYTNTANPQDIYILVVGNAASSIPPNPNGAEGCYDIVTLTLIVDPVPANNGPLEMALCDDELQGSAPDDEISTFDLTTQNILVTGGDPNLTVQWYATPADEAADNPIVDPTMYQNIATPQTVIARVTSEFGCSNRTTLTLTVLPNPSPKMDPEPLVQCDDDDDGIRDGFVLTDRDAEILDGETNVTILYYGTEQEAIDAVPGTELTSPYTNTVPYSQIVFARVTNNVPPELLPCYTIVELELIVVPLPDAPDATLQDPLTACDDDGDGQAIFDLTVQDAAVYGVQDPVNFAPITYYEDQADAEAGINAINPADAFQSGGQTIWVRLESLDTGCARVSSFEIEVGQYPGTGLADDLVLCDDELNGSTNDDGISTFDLTVNTPVLTGGDPTLAVYYYASQDDRDNDIRIVSPGAYQNVVVPQQEIFVTVVGQNTCRALLSFLITVSPNPTPVAPTPLVACDVDSDGFTFFDLESKTAEIRGGDPTLLITYHESLFDATTGNFPLASPYENIFAFNQTIYVRAAYSAPPAGTGCYTIVTLGLIVNPTPVIPLDLPTLVRCTQDGLFAEFDLTVQEDPDLRKPEPCGLYAYLSPNGGGRDCGAHPLLYNRRRLPTPYPQGRPFGSAWMIIIPTALRLAVLRLL